MGGLPNAWQDTSTLGPDASSNKVKLACSWDTGSGRVHRVAQAWLEDVIPSLQQALLLQNNEPGGLTVIATSSRQPSGLFFLPCVWASTLLAMCTTQFRIQFYSCVAYSGFPDLAHKNTGGPGKYELQVKNE